MGIVVLGAVFVDVKGYPLSTYIPGGRNVGRVEQVPGGVSRNVVGTSPMWSCGPPSSVWWTTPAWGRMWCGSYGTTR